MRSKRRTNRMGTNIRKSNSKRNSRKRTNRRKNIRRRNSRRRNSRKGKMDGVVLAEPVEGGGGRQPVVSGRTETEGIVELLYDSNRFKIEKVEINTRGGRGQSTVTTNRIRITNKGGHGTIADCEVV